MLWRKHSSSVFSLLSKERCKFIYNFDKNKFFDKKLLFFFKKK